METNLKVRVRGRQRCVGETGNRDLDGNGLSSTLILDGEFRVL